MPLPISLVMVADQTLHHGQALDRLPVDDLSFELVCRSSSTIQIGEGQNSVAHRRDHAAGRHIVSEGGVDEDLIVEVADPDLRRFELTGLTAMNDQATHVVELLLCPVIESVCRSEASIPQDHSALDADVPSIVDLRRTIGGGCIAARRGDEADEDQHKDPGASHRSALPENRRQANTTGSTNQTPRTPNKA